MNREDMMEAAIAKSDVLLSVAKRAMTEATEVLPRECEEVNGVPCVDIYYGVLHILDDMQKLLREALEEESAA